MPPFCIDFASEPSLRMPDNPVKYTQQHAKTKALRAGRQKKLNYFPLHAVYLTVKRDIAQKGFS